jgi:hypothetical protein
MKPGDEEMARLRPLVERTETSTPGEARLLDLVQASGGVEVSDAAKEKIYASVLARRQTERRQRFVSLRPAFVFGVVLLAAAATAAAALGHRWLQERRGAATAIAPPAPRPRAQPVSPRHEDVAAPPVAPAEVPAAAPERRHPHASRARARSEDSSAVVTALEALRNHHDPDRAAELLAGYLAAHPEGALAEEALALSIEAAGARHDPAAIAFADRYLRSYPNGRFRHSAEAALARR